jgi:hypothetical protein
MGENTEILRRDINDKKGVFLAQLFYFSAKYTLAVLVVFTCCVLALLGLPIEEKFMYLTYSIVGFYFGKDSERKERVNSHEKQITHTV